MSIPGGQPKLSVILPTADDFATIRATVRALAAQTARSDIELVIVSPTDNPGLIESEVRGFANVVTVNAGPLSTSNIFRAAGIRKATAPIVVLGEDHSFPEAGWAQALIDAHAGGEWAVAGPVIANANPRSMLSWANLLLEYAPWFDGAEGGERDELPGHNSAYRRDLLLQYGPKLEEVFEVESVVQRELRAAGHKLLLEPRARTRHLNFSRLRSALYLRFHAGRSYAGHRVAGWTRLKRVTFAAGSPLIPAVRLVRIVRMLASSDRYAFLLPRILPQLALCLICDGVGELAGYFTGPGDSPQRLGAIEFNRARFMNAADLAALGGAHQPVSIPERGVEPAPQAG